MRQLFATNDFINPTEFMTLYIKQIFQKKRSKMLDSLIQNQTSFSSNMVPVGIKSLVLKGMVMIGMQILISYEIWTHLIKDRINH